MVQFRKRKSDGQSFPVGNNKKIRASNPSNDVGGFKLGKGTKVPNFQGIDMKPSKIADTGFKRGEIIIRSDNFSFFANENGLDLSLSAMGWDWSGDESSINDFLHRIVLSEDEIEKFEDSLDEANVDFDELKPFMLKSISKKVSEENDDGIYTISGDNGRWKFGNDADSIDVGSEFDFAESEEGLIRKEKNDFEEEFFQNFTSVTYKEFIDSNGEWINERMKEIIKESVNFDDYASKIESLKESVEDSYRELEIEHTSEATTKSIAEIKSRREVEGTELKPMGSFEDAFKKSFEDAKSRG